MTRKDEKKALPDAGDVTPEQAADLLNVSQEYLTRLLEEGCLPFRETSGQRRLRVEDVLALKQQRDQERTTGLRELTKLTEESGGYDAEQE